MGDKWFIGFLVLVYGIGFALAAAIVVPILAVFGWFLYLIFTM